MHIILPTLLFLLLGMFQVEAVEITALSPSVAEPGSRVTVLGEGLEPGTLVGLGDQLIEPEALAPTRLQFTIPPLPEGEYALYLQYEEQSSKRTFFLSIVEPPPQIISLSPVNIDECSTAAERRVVVSGRNFKPGANLLLDGAAVPVSGRSETGLTFTTPLLAGGSHEVQVVNPSGKSSLTHSLFINSIPEILSVSQGQDNVTEYHLIIEGKNFLYSSMLVVNGTPILRNSGRQPTQADHVEYQNCRTMIYLRHPYSRELKRVSLQVVNHGNLQSPVHFVTIP